MNVVKRNGMIQLGFVLRKDRSDWKESGGNECRSRERGSYGEWNKGKGVTKQDVGKCHDHHKINPYNSKENDLKTLAL